jgi:hypothetical protein
VQYVCSRIGVGSGNRAKSVTAKNLWACVLSSASFLARAFCLAEPVDDQTV